MIAVDLQLRLVESVSTTSIGWSSSTSSWSLLAFTSTGYATQWAQRSHSNQSTVGIILFMSQVNNCAHADWLRLGCCSLPFSYRAFTSCDFAYLRWTSLEMLHFDGRYSTSCFSHCMPIVLPHLAKIQEERWVALVLLCVYVCLFECLTDWLTYQVCVCMCAALNDAAPIDH